MKKYGHNSDAVQTVFRNIPEDVPYTCIPNNLLQPHKTMSDDCRHLINELLSRPLDWIITLKTLHEKGRKGRGRNKVYDLIEEAIIEGYMGCLGGADQRQKSGKFNKYNYWVSAVPNPEKEGLASVKNREAVVLLVPQNREAADVVPGNRKPDKYIGNSAPYNEGDYEIASGSLKEGSGSPVPGFHGSRKPESGINNKVKNITNKKTSKKDFALDCDKTEITKFKRWHQSELEQVFSIFWNACPRKIGKVKAREKFEILIKSKKGLAPQSTPETLTACMSNYAKKNKNSEDRYILHPVTWLNQERWVDEMESLPIGIAWGWWRTIPGWELLTLDDWRGMIKKNQPIDTWPWQKLGPPPGHPECLMPVDVQIKFGDKYSNQNQQLIQQYGE